MRGKNVNIFTVCKRSTFFWGGRGKTIQPQTRTHIKWLLLCRKRKNTKDLRDKMKQIRSGLFKLGRRYWKAGTSFSVRLAGHEDYHPPPPQIEMKCPLWYSGTHLEVETDGTCFTTVCAYQCLVPRACVWCSGGGGGSLWLSRSCSASCLPTALTSSRAGCRCAARLGTSKQASHTRFPVFFFPLSLRGQREVLMLLAGASRVGFRVPPVQNASLSQPAGSCGVGGKSVASCDRVRGGNR